MVELWCGIGCTKQETSESAGSQPYSSAYSPTRNDFWTFIQHAPWLWACPTYNTQAIAFSTHTNCSLLRSGRVLAASWLSPALSRLTDDSVGAGTIVFNPPLAWQLCSWHQLIGCGKRFRYESVPWINRALSSSALSPANLLESNFLIKSPVDCDPRSRRREVCHQTSSSLLPRTLWGATESHDKHNALETCNCRLTHLPPPCDCRSWLFVMPLSRCPSRCQASWRQSWHWDDFQTTCSHRGKGI